VHFVLDAVETLDLRQVRVNSRDTGSVEQGDLILHLGRNAVWNSASL